jgi:chorismate lyase/3-hydroxybenzoate synthase
VAYRASHPLVSSGRRVTHPSSGLELSYVDPSHIDSWLTTQERHPLAAITFGTPAPAGLDCPVLSLDLPQLSERPRIELWTTGQPVHAVRKECFAAAMTEDMAAAWVTFDEQPGVSFEHTTYDAYRRLLSELQEFGYPHLLRAWNYFPAINKDQDGLERYQRFTVGRYEAFAEMLSDFPLTVPAGTAVGTASGPLTILVLAGVQPGIHLGNPRQVNAYEYPAHYGPRSPSFARATSCRMGDDRHLYIAGTASVVGHATRHIGLPLEQTRETVENLKSLLHHADDMTGAHFGAQPRQSIFKVYVRHSDDLPLIRKSLALASLSMDQCLFLQGDLCRRDLLVEIEGFITSS